MSADTAAGSAAASAEVRSEGQLQLTRLTVSLGAIAKRTGVSRQSVHDWRRGEKTPAAQARLKLQAAYGIDPGAWDVEPDGRAPATAPEPSSATAGVTTALQEAETTLRGIRDQLDRPKLRVGEVVRLREAEMKAIRLVSQLETAEALLEDRIVRGHPAWRRIRAVIVRFAERLSPTDRQELIQELERAEGGG